MAIEYKFAGKKDSRKVVKTIDISEDSYSAIKSMVESGQNMTDAVTVPLIEDTYKIFGGNCYGPLVSMAIEQMICTAVHQLEDKNMLIVEGNEVFHKLNGIILPLMCYTTNGEEYGESLNFFNPDGDEIIEVVGECVKKEKSEWFNSELRNTLYKDDRPAGEIACGLLMYMANDDD